MSESTEKVLPDVPKKKRKENWDSKEISRLLDHVEDKYDQLIGKFSSTITNEKKKSLWSKIAEEFPGRTADDCKKKFLKLKSEKISEYNQHMKSVKGTGGGPAPDPLSHTAERIIAILGVDNPKIQGIEGGFDTASELETDRFENSAASLDDETENSTSTPSTSEKPPRKRPLTSLENRPSKVDDDLKRNLQEQHELITKKIKREMEIFDLQETALKLQIENEEKRKLLLDHQLTNMDDNYAFLQ